MDPKLNEIETSPWNEIFKVVFFPDRIYHAQYLNATRSSRYRYNVQEVRSYIDIIVIKGEVYLDGQFLSNFLRLEYKSSRLVEQAREKLRFVKKQLIAWVKVLPENEANTAEGRVKLYYCPWTDAFQVEIWETLEPPENSYHDFQILDQMGYNRPITCLRELKPALRDIKGLKRVELAFRENDRNIPAGYQITDTDAAWDNAYLRSHQEPRTQDPSSPQNTIDDQNYLIDFQRGWFLQTPDILPVRYRNAMMDDSNPDRNPDNIIEMRWIVQRELGGSMVFFHEVTIPPGTVEGTHQHIGTEELYYITQGEGIAYMRVGDDPATDSFPTVTRDVMGLGEYEFKELPVKPGSVIFTKSGGMHGIRNPGTEPLKFVAFLYHTT
ncbi:cupin [Aphanothece hegewaldii CCALA 016]|uniref:Cupin n=1 Tax=Aphanothece hegewaldii CCALA 016 TaxID=2107694 RepID=A0A2T1M0Q2_9CHRO|nr:cupin domain-containing protein [Aphanothece hegewaldii]PSF38259.1 cupin [Aphanothece hegewaldii CCALA 016]